MLLRETQKKVPLTPAIQAPKSDKRPKTPVTAAMPCKIGDHFIPLEADRDQKRCDLPLLFFITPAFHA